MLARSVAPVTLGTPRRQDV